MNIAAKALVIGAIMVVVLIGLGRVGWCDCGQWNLWAGDIWSRHNSQHLFDPYVFTHVTHGVLFYLLLHLVARDRLTVGQRLLVALGLEAGWEVLENTPLVIDRYREATISLDYYGDSILNSLGDLLACAAGFGLAARLPVWATVAGTLLSEVVLLLWIRDSLLLNVWMLLFSTEALQRWQQGG